MKKTHATPSTSPGRFLMRKICLIASLAMISGSVLALESLDDSDMSSVNGAGLAFALDDFSFRMAPTSYVELTGSTPTTQAAGKGWKRGDARYYGMSLTNGESAGTDWFGNGCGTFLGCPIGTANSYGVRGFASVYNPFVLRVFQYDGFNYQGTSTTSTGTGATLAPTVLEFVGPSQSDPYRWAFWGEMEIGRGSAYSTSTATSGVTAYPGATAGAGCLASGNGNTTFCGLQSQTMILGKPIASGRTWSAASPNTYTAGTVKPAILRLMQTDYDSNSDVRGTLGVTYQSALSGDFRFSVRLNNTANTGLLHQVPDFNDSEGLFFRNVDAFMPLGTLHYQSVIFGGLSSFDASANPLATPTQNGNFVIELTRIPNIANIYNNFYCGNTDGSACTQDANGYVASPNPNTHAYVRWGNWADPTSALGTTSTSNPTGTSTTNGIYFTDGATTVNIGNARIEGMLIHHMKITTLGAGT